MRIRVIASNLPTQSSLLTALRYEGLRPATLTVTRSPKVLNDMFSPFGAVVIEADAVNAAVLDSVRSALDGMRAMACQLLSTPVVVVVRSASAKERCSALDAGADDVLVAPAAKRDVENRVRTIHERMRRGNAA